MDMSRLTQRTQEALNLAQQDAVRRGQMEVDTEHLAREGKLDPVIGRDDEIRA
jgi:ATP-dependent Clp protease ATP-binding subunit ClpA